MKCISPRPIPAKAVRQADFGKGEFRHLKERRKGALREVPCGKCHACMTNRRLNHQHRVLTEFQYLGTVPYLFTLTFAEAFLPHSQPVPAGELTARQEVLQARILKRSQNGARLSEHDSKKLAIMAGENPSMPTVASKLITNWRDNVERGIPKLMILPVSEYGTQFGRPHAHALIAQEGRELTMDQLEWIKDRWPYGFVHILPALSDKALRYIVKDTQKGTWQKEYYTAENREPPKVHWPRRGRYMGRSMEHLVDQGLKGISKLCPMARELAIQNGGTGKWMRVNGKHRPISKTAYQKVMQAALEDGRRDPVAKANVQRLLDFTAWDAYSETQPGEPNYKPEMARKRQEKLDNAKAASDQTKRRHERLLIGKRKRKSRFPSG